MAVSVNMYIVPKNNSTPSYIEHSINQTIEHIVRRTCAYSTLVALRL